MATPSEVVGLFAEIAGTGGRIDQAKAVSRAVKALNSLDGDQKREMAILVAERVAPDLVPKIQEETGVDLTIAQVQAVLDMARRLEPEDVTELQEVVAAREGLATLPPPVAPAAADPDPDVAAVPDAAAVVADPEPDLIDDELEVRLAEAEQERLRLLAEAEEERERAVAAAVASRQAAEAEARAALTAAREQADDMLRRAEETARVAEPEATPDDADLDDASTGGGPAVRHHDAVRAAPDGWQRRRALERLLRAGEVDADEVAGLIRLVSRPMDRAWVAATAVESGTLTPDDLDDLLEPRAAARLQRRYR